MQDGRHADPDGQDDANQDDANAVPPTPSQKADPPVAADTAAQLLERVTDAFLALDAQWRVVYLNDRAAQTLGRRRADLLGKDLWAELPEGVGGPFHRAYTRAMSTQLPEHFEEYAATRGRWFSNHVYPSPEGLTVFFTDITERKAREASLRQYQDIFRLAEVGLVIGTGDGTILGVMNPAFARMHGYEVEELQGRPVRDVYAPEVRGQLPSLVRRTEEMGHTVYESLHVHKDGTTFPVSVDTTAVKDEAGRVLYRIVNVTDITQRKQAEAALQAAALRLEALIGNIQAGVIVEDDQARLVLTNQAFCEMMGLGVQAQAIVGANVVPMARHTARQFADPDGFVERALELRRQQRPVQAEELRLVDGRVWERDYVPVFPHQSVSPGGGYGGHLWLFRDVTERRRIEQQVRDDAVLLEFQNGELARANAELARTNLKLERANARLEALARTDGLTGLLNQRVFAERLAEEFRRARRYGEPLSLIVLDVDRFKVYNDAFGHLAGNAALQEVARVLQQHARETDLAARFGGEEFALILPHTERGEAVALAERLRAAVEGADWGAGRAVTASFGVCELTPEVGTPEALIGCADAAMYRAKAGGRNRVERV